LIKNIATMGISLTQFLIPAWVGSHHIYVDAATASGMGIYFHDNKSSISVQWEQLIIPSNLKFDIEFQELFACVAALYIAAEALSNTSVSIHGDNMGVVWSLIKRSCVMTRIDLLMGLTIIGEVCLKYNIKYWIVYLPSKWNVLADGLSRNKSNIYQDFPLQPTSINNPISIVQDLLDYISSNISQFSSV